MLSRELAERQKLMEQLEETKKHNLEVRKQKMHELEMLSQKKRCVQIGLVYILKNSMHFIVKIPTWYHFISRGEGGG